MSDYIKIANIRGLQEDNKVEMIKDDFYTLCISDPKENIGLRNNGMITFKISDVSLEYLCSDFVRFCLALYKTKQNLHRGELKIISKQPLSISDELKEYIEEFLPDYYGIRDNVKI